MYTLGRWVVFSSQTHGKFTAFYRDAMGKGALHAADSLAFQAGACPLKKLQTVLPVLQNLTDREQKRPKTLPVLQILTDREHRPEGRVPFSNWASSGGQAKGRLKRKPPTKLLPTVFLQGSVISGSSCNRTGRCRQVPSRSS